METMKHASDSIISYNQKIVTDWRIVEDGQIKIRVFLRYDDECKNGHNTFSITGETKYLDRGKWYEGSSGCIHDEIAKYFPEYAHLIKWHLTSSDMPMYYINNTLFLAGERDCWGRLKGEPCNFKKSLYFGDFPISYNKRFSDDFIDWLLSLGQNDKENLQIEEVEHEKISDYNFALKYTFKGYALEWHQCYFDSLREIEEFREALIKYPIIIREYPTSFGEGKERQLDSARASAVWPDATDDDLCSPDLRQKLLDRLPSLMAEFRKDMESLGFVW